MKLLHLSDLHLGKRVNEYSMLEDQAYILTKIINIIDEEKPDAVLIAGDIYDKAIPPAEAVELCDDFLVRLAKRGLQVFIISGNHDSPERLAFCGRLLESNGIHISPVYDGNIKPITMEDSYGKLDIFLLPYIKPAHVRRFFPEEELKSYTEAVAAALRQVPLEPLRRNVLVAHQFVTGAVQGGSEELYVGGSENIDASVLADFDYVALGHIHGAQNVGGGPIRYCGTPLKYSFAESKQQKSVTVVELRQKGDIQIRTVELSPLHDLVELRGSYDELLLRSFYEGRNLQEAYTHITLTDEEDIPDAIGKLRVVYHRLMRLDYDNTRTRTGSVITADAGAQSKSPLELFCDFYEMQNGQPMSEEQLGYMKGLIENIWEGTE